MAKAKTSTTIDRLVKAANELRTIVAGSRHWQDRAPVSQTLRDYGITLLGHGDCKGLDWIAHEAATSDGVNVIRMAANWNKYGKAAGPIRNRLLFDMVRPHIVLAFPLADSVGTWDMVDYAESRDCAVIVIGDHDRRRR